MKFDHINQLCDIVRETSFALHWYHRNGHMEKVYENGLRHRLRKIGLDVSRQHPPQVYDEDGTLIGEFFADPYFENQLIVELKAARAVVHEHIAQLLGYLKLGRVETGMLINFGSPILHAKKYFMTDPNPV
ncbi:MAG: GxxExxY protein [Undibacterium sp.]|nr:GxxExxY protein [Opitutaceae bacterium]